MRHRVLGRQLSRNTAHRKALRRNLAIALFQHGAIRTTEAKAKELRPYVERLITRARKGTLHARRMVSAELGNRRGQRGELYKVVDGNKDEMLEKSLLQILFDDIAPRYATRPGGYTRIVRLADRRIGDAGKQVLLQLVEETKAAGSKGGGDSRRSRRAAQRRQAVQAATASAPSAPAEAAAQPEPPAGKPEQT